MSNIARKDSRYKSLLSSENKDSLDISQVQNTGSMSQEKGRTKITHVLTGTIIYTTLSWIYDYPIYTLVIWYFGILKGGLIMALFSIPLDLLTLRFYDWSKEDWFAIEYIKSMREYSGKNPFKKFIGYILRSTSLPVQVIVLSIKFNSFVVTTLLREGAYKYRGFSRRDWCIFWSSFVVTQTYWIFIIGGGLKLGAEIKDLLVK